MYVILGATGHIGAAAADHLLAHGEPVLGIAHDERGAVALRAKGAEAAVVDVNDPAALREVLRHGRRGFLLNPPADPATDTDAVETASALAIAAALDGSGLEKVVVASAYGAQPGEAIGDLSVLYGFEQRVTASGISTAINRGAYYYTNLDALLPAARDGTLPTMFPADLVLPMVAPADLGRAAAERLLSGPEDTGIRYVEGPERLSFGDVARAFSAMLGRSVGVQVIPRDRWEASYRELGFSAPAARAFARMTAATVDGVDLPDDPTRGTITLEEYLKDLVERSGT